MPRNRRQTERQGYLVKELESQAMNPSRQTEQMSISAMEPNRKAEELGRVASAAQHQIMNPTTIQTLFTGSRKVAEFKLTIERNPIIFTKKTRLTWENKNTTMRA